MALAYCLLCHNNAAYVADLFRYLYRTGDHFIVHVDRKAPAALHRLLADLADRFSNVYVMPPTLCSWGGYSLVEATLRSMAFASAGVLEWEHFVLLSEQHVPLVSPEEIARRLLPGVSYIENTPVLAFGPEGQDDIAHRFALHYRELPGVGGFGTRPRGLLPNWMQGLHHASQWVVLSREACERLTAEPAHPALQRFFADSLLADETALPTLLRGTAIGAGLLLDAANPTFVASFGNGGAPDMTLTQASLRLANDQGCLFTRKRPPLLPADLAAMLEAGAGLLPSAVQVAHEDGRDTRSLRQLGEALRHNLSAIYPDGWIESADPGLALCYLIVRTPSDPPDLRVVVLSADLIAFKVAVIWQTPFDGSYAPRRIGRFPATVLKVRLPEIFEMREVHVFDAPGHGFVTIRPGDGVGRLSQTIAQALAVIRVLEPGSTDF